jgi:PAS domain S-box-containing protein
MSLIVIVDDRLTNRSVFSRLAASIEADVVVRAFGDPREALEWLENNPPSLVITDYRMPHFDGAEFIRRFRQIPGAEDIPAIVITVYEERLFRLRALEAGATDFLNSPVDHYEFVTRARNLLKLQKHQVLLAERAAQLARLVQQEGQAQNARERNLRDACERLGQVIDNLPTLVSAVRADGTILLVNEQQTQFAGLPAEDVVNKPAAVLFGAERALRHSCLDANVFDTGMPLPDFDEQVLDKAGTQRFLRTRKTPLKDRDGRVAGVLTSSVEKVSRDAAVQHAAIQQEAIQQEAISCAARQLRAIASNAGANFADGKILREQIHGLIARGRRGESMFALHLVDLGLTGVRASSSSPYAEGELRAVARKLAGRVRGEDALARLDGAEIVVLQSNVTRPEQAADFAQRIMSAVREPKNRRAGDASQELAFGVALHPRDGSDFEELLRHARGARARASGKFA